MSGTPARAPDTPAAGGYRRLLLTLACAALLPIIPFAVIGELPGERWLQASGDSALHFGLAGALLLGSDLLLPVPSSLIGAALGARLGLVAGALWTFGGLLLGHVVGYALGRLLPARWAGEAPRAPGPLLVFLSRPVPVFAEAATLAAGVHRMGVRAFLGSCAAGDAIYALAMAADGAAFLPEGLGGPGLVIPMAVPAVGWLLYRGLSRQRPHA